MSADNWTYCPRCVKKEESRIKDLLLEAGKAYGKVSAEKYLEMLAEAEKKPDHQETLREDFEIGIWKGNFEISYRAYCDVCGFKHNFEHKEEIK